GAAEATSLAMRELTSAAEQDEELYYLYVLRLARQGWNAELRRRYFETFAHTSGYLGGDGMPSFLRQIHEQAVATLTAAERTALGDLALLNSERAETPPPPRPHVKPWTLEELSDALAQLPAGNTGRGREVFRNALCSRCHRAGAQGRPVGPDLTNVGSRFRAADLLRSIVKPSDVVAEKYQLDEIVTEDGRRLTGISSWGGDYRSPVLQLITDPLLPSQFVAIPKQEIAAQRKSTVSPMPTGLLDSFQPGEIQDLLAFLANPAP
ncbi:MAG: c-type cytochrome, partial [Planctomycetales bacterium]|nr:c-type cytochrome [Planctomycetales bacterium]